MTRTTHAHGLLRSPCPPSPGIGYDLTVAIAKAGAEVIAVTRTQADLDALVAECGSAIHPVLLDIADTAAVADTLGAVGDIDMVVNNAGIANLQPFLEVDAGSFDQVMNINVRAAMQVSQIAAKSMIARGVKGSIVNVSSQASQIALGEHTSYVQPTKKKKKKRSRHLDHHSAHTSYLGTSQVTASPCFSAPVPAFARPSV